MHTMAFRTQPSSPAPANPPSTYDTPPSLRRTSSIWIHDGSETSENSSYDDDVCYVMSGSFEKPEALPPSASPPTIKLRVKNALLTLSLTALMLGTAYYMGGVHARRPLEIKLHQAEELKSVLLENQTRLLSEKAKLDRLPKVNKDLTKTIEEMQNELRVKEQALKEEEQRRLSRDEELMQVFNQYQHNGEEREHSERQRREDLVKFVRTLAYDHYGTDKRDVEFQVRVWEDGDATEGSFVVEVADFDDMPLSAFLFLQQVDHGLWDKTSFYINAPHVLLAQPMSAAKDINRLPEMEAMGLARLPMHEYSDELNHERFTLGFGSSLSTAGSFFYINKVDNSRTQAGQPCFGRVVDGFDIIERILDLDADDVDFRIDPVEIVSVKLLEYDQEPPRDGEMHHEHSGHPEDQHQGHVKSHKRHEEDDHRSERDHHHEDRDKDEAHHKDGDRDGDEHHREDKRHHHDEHHDADEDHEHEHEDEHDSEDEHHDEDEHHHEDHDHDHETHSVSVA